VPALVGWTDRVVAVEQLEADLSFQLADLERQRRLRKVQPRGGAGETPLLHNHDEGAKLLQCDVSHIRPFSLIGPTNSIRSFGRTPLGWGQHARGGRGRLENATWESARWPLPRPPIVSV